MESGGGHSSRWKDIYPTYLGLDSQCRGQVEREAGHARRLKNDDTNAHSKAAAPGSYPNLRMAIVHFQVGPAMVAVRAGCKLTVLERRLFSQTATVGIVLGTGMIQRSGRSGRSRKDG